MKNNINVAGYHLPLDAHEVVGNNILLLEKFFRYNSILVR